MTLPWIWHDSLSLFYFCLSHSSYSSFGAPWFCILCLVHTQIYWFRNFRSHYFYSSWRTVVFIVPWPQSSEIPWKYNETPKCILTIWCWTFHHCPYLQFTIHLNRRIVDLWQLLKNCSIVIIYGKMLGEEGLGRLEGDIPMPIEPYHEKKRKKYIRKAFCFIFIYLRNKHRELPVLHCAKASAARAGSGCSWISYWGGRKPVPWAITTAPQCLNY